MLVDDRSNSRTASATSFITFLAKIGYPNASSLRPEQLLWVFEIPEIQTLFDWLCKNVDPEENVVNPIRMKTDQAAINEET
ncbi:3113_t:CDS:2, partial [Paraglomus occultum]